MKKKVCELFLIVIGLGFVFNVISSEAKTRFESKDSIVVALSAPILTLDPAKSAGTPAETVRRGIYEGLVMSDEKNHIHPNLAEKWEVSPDGLNWTFALRKGVKFHDGTELTSQSVKDTINRLLDEKIGSNRRYMYTFIQSVETPDKYTVKFSTKAPQANFLHMLTESGAFPISSKALEKYGNDIAENPCGTGPYKLDKKVTGEYVSLTRFDDYWGGKPKLSGIKFITVAEEGTRVAMIENGEADFIVNVPPQDLTRLQGTEGLAIRRDPSNRVAHIGINLKKSPFDKLQIRQALNYAVDRELIIRGVCSGLGEEAKSILAPATWGFAAVSPYTYNEGKARELLAQAGLPNGFKAKLWTPQGRYFRDKETALAVAGQLKKIGIDLDVEIIDWGQYLKELKVAPDAGNKVELYMLGWESITGEASYIFNTVFVSKNIPPTGWNTMFYSNSKVDELNEISIKTIDDPKRFEMFKQCQEIIVSEAPWIPLYVYEQLSAHRSDMKGIKSLPMEVFNFNAAFIQK